jgi:HAD superfamily hydrolase (TIGR01490 family)
VSAPKFAVFDIDGTLVRWQLYHALFDQLAKDGHISPNLLRATKDARMQWKKRENPDAFDTYQDVLVASYSAALKSLNPPMVEKAAQKVADQYRFQTYTYTTNLIATLKKHGYVLFAISGSHTELLDKIAPSYGFDDWVGTVYEVREGHYTGRVDVAAQHKAERLTKLITTHRASGKDSYAIGDSESDVPMLAMVENPIAFNPDARLYARAKTAGWKIVIERKNVIYELQPQSGGSYVLA